jgi:hypothetical protein
MQFLRTVAVLFATLVGVAYAVTSVEIRGQNFVNPKTNKRMMIIGVE